MKLVDREIYGQKSMENCFFVKLSADKKKPNRSDKFQKQEKFNPFMYNAPKL